MTTLGFEMCRSSTINTHNPYRFGGAWGYVTDPSGMLQLGVRFYWPEIGRFVQQDPIGDGINWYAYVGNNPVVFIDPYGLQESTSFWVNVFGMQSVDQLGMSSRAWASGFFTGARFGQWRPDWRDRCDQWGNRSRNWGIVSGVATSAAVGRAIQNPMDARTMFRPFWRYVDDVELAAIKAGGRAGRWMVRGKSAPYAVKDASRILDTDHGVVDVVRVRVPFWRPVGGPRPVAGGAARALEWYQGWSFPH